MVEPRVDALPVVHQSFVHADAVAETRVERERRPVGLDGRRAGRRGARVVRTRTGGAAATGAGGAGAEGGAASRPAVRGRVTGVAAAVVVRAADQVALAPRTVPAALDPRYALVRESAADADAVPVRPVVVAGPHGHRYAVLVRVDDALLDGRQPRRRGPVKTAGRRRRRRRARAPVAQTLGRRRRALVHARRVVRVRLTVVPGTAALVARPMVHVVLVVHVNWIYSAKQAVGTVIIQCIILQSIN